MKLIIAIIKPFKLEALQQALLAVNVTGMTVTEVTGYGRQKGHIENYRAMQLEVNFVEKIRVEIAIEADKCQDVIEKIVAATRTGEVGDGKIFVLPLEEVIRIRTGETQSAAI